MEDLRLFLGEHPDLVWLFNFPAAISNPGSSLPTARYLTQMLRQLPNQVLQFILKNSVRLIIAELASRGVSCGECISLDTKHILAWVKENNPKAYVDTRYDKTRQPAGDPDCKLGCKRRHNRRGTSSNTENPPTPTTNPVPAKNRDVGEFYWGYGSGIVVVKVPGWGEFVLAEMTQTFDKGDSARRAITRPKAASSAPKGCLAALPGWICPSKPFLPTAPAPSSNTSAASMSARCCFPNRPARPVPKTTKTGRRAALLICR